ncbi:MAG: hypothetical protein ACRETP_11775 [Steroidobacteraceae bacterium]
MALIWALGGTGIVASIPKSAGADSWSDRVTAQIIVGVDAAGNAHHPPADWPAVAGRWNGKGARLLPSARKLIFETFRHDIRGGSVAAPRRAAGIPELQRSFIAGPETGSLDVDGTSVLYVADADGSNPYCLGCTDIKDGENGVNIYRAAPNAGATATAPIRRHNAMVYANQNKDLAVWYPDGRWIIASVEMPRHALAHRLGNSEIGMFNDLWAISADGKTWVQLTDFAAGWKYTYGSVALPVQCTDKPRCPAGCQYASAAHPHPYGAYACSAVNEPPPVLGAMRTTVGHMIHAGHGVPLSWGERVGINGKYTWAGPLQLAVADIVLVDGLPTLVNYQRNVTPTPEHPDGRHLWSNPGGGEMIGAGYEPWTFSGDDACLGIATDAFLSTSRRGVSQKVSPTSQAFTDVAVWCRNPPSRLSDVTAYDAVIYPYQPNALSGEARYYGHWEEPMVFAADDAGHSLIAFASSANLDPPWNPLKHKDTFGLEIWLVRADRAQPAVRLTYFNDPARRVWAYPTAFDARDRRLYITVVPGKMPGANPPGALYTLPITRAQ